MTDEDKRLEYLMHLGERRGFEGLKTKTANAPGEIPRLIEELSKSVVSVGEIGEKLALRLAPVCRLAAVGEAERRTEENQAASGLGGELSAMLLRIRALRCLLADVEARLEV